MKPATERNGVVIPGASGLALGALMCRERFPCAYP